MKTSLKDIALKRALGHLLPQGWLESYFPRIHFTLTLGSAIQTLKGCCSQGPREPGYCLSWQQTLASSTWCWFCKNVGCWSYRVIEVSTQISNEGLGGQAMARILEGSLWKGGAWSCKHAAKLHWRSQEVRNVRNMEHLLRKTAGREHNKPGREAMRTTANKNIRAELPKPSGSHILLPCFPDAGHRDIEFHICPTEFHFYFDVILSFYASILPF